MGKIVQTAGRTALGEYAPQFAHFNDDVLLVNWNNQDIDVKTRSIITVVSLMSMGITDSSLKFHLQNAKAHGVTQKEIAAVITHVAFYAGWPKAWAVFKSCQGSADFDIAASMLQLFIKKTLGSVTFNRPRVVICIPSGVTAVERRAVREVAFKAGARQVAIVEEPMAAAIGAGLTVAEPTGCMVVDIGGGTAEVAVISMGSIVASRSVRSAGDEFEKEIIAYVKRKYNVLIGDRTAEEIKIAIASAAPYEGEEPYSVMGRNLVDGFPKEVTLTPAEIREVLSEQIGVIIDAILTTLERTPPELSADILETGITLAGGGAMLHGMDKLVAQQTGMPVFIAEEPLDCVARGTGAILESPETFSRTLFFDNRPSR